MKQLLKYIHSNAFQEEYVIKTSLSPHPPTP